tara:strand:- start:1580 stop:2332 length:753 start_codon:yes stop_codon:yes gene_type:complete
VKNNFFKNPVGNIYLKPQTSSEVSSQILFGEKFKILSKKKNWFKIRTYYDNYVGYIKKTNFLINFRPTKKICKVRSKIFKKKGINFIPTNDFLYFGSGISIKDKNSKFIEFEKNRWIKKRDVKDIFHVQKNFIKVLKLFVNVKYLWGGKTFEGIDCSALVQIYFFYNRIFFPRDSKDQMKYCKKKLNKKFDKGDIIFWKGHVGVCISKSKFIHAYGPKKKVLIMPTNLTIETINKTADLKIKKISNIKRF